MDNPTDAAKKSWAVAESILGYFDNYKLGSVAPIAAEIETALCDARDTTAMPWHRAELKRWAIVGMNHYHVGGQRRLYVSMTWRGPGRCCITAEGEDGPEIWDNLARQSVELIGEQN